MTSADRYIVQKTNTIIQLLCFGKTRIGFWTVCVLECVKSLVIMMSMFFPNSLRGTNAFPFTDICSNIQRLLKYYLLCFSGQDIADELREKVVLTLQQAVGVADSNRLADTYLRLARFCHQLGIDTLCNPVLNLIKLINWWNPDSFYYLYTIHK